ncbi:MAG: hypothetical protein RIR00_2593 [Pseudomonadota bacterium]|jgi:hypothetical protein
MLKQGLIGLLLWFCAGLAVAADNRNLAPGFFNLPLGARVALMQPDIELFSLSAGGITEPRADWTDAALQHVRRAVRLKTGRQGLSLREVSEDEADELAEINALHAAVANAIAMHHLGPSNLALPTKNGQLDWSLGEAVLPLQQRSGSDYALFIWMRDSYASAERKVAMVAMALLGVGITAGFQAGYASLVDLRSGQVLWFNRMFRGSGDLREAASADETVQTLLKNFPGSL